MKDIINSSKSFLLLLPSDPTVDIITAVLGFANTLLPDKKVVIGTSRPIPQDISEAFDLSPYEIVTNLKQREVILTLNGRKGRVEDVRWRESDEKIQFIITPQKGEFEYNDVDIHTTGDDFDVYITIGCRQLTDIGEMYQNNRDLFEKRKIVNIDIHPQNEKYGAVNEIGTGGSLSAWVLELLDTKGFQVKKDGMELLFKGILWEHGGFRETDILANAMKKLRQVDGELLPVLDEMYNSLTIAQLRYLGKLIANITMHDSGIITAKALHNEIQGVAVSRVLYPEMDIVSRLKDCEYAAVLAEVKSGQVIVKVYSKNDGTNLPELFAEYNPTGSIDRITFDAAGSLDEVETKIVRVLKGMAGEAPASQAQTSEENAPVHIPQMAEPIVTEAPDQTTADQDEALRQTVETEKNKDTNEEKKDNGNEDDGDEPLEKAKKLPKAEDVEESSPQSPTPQNPAMPYAPPIGGGFPGGPLAPGQSQF